MFLKVLWEEACLAEYKGGTFCRLGVPYPDDLTGVDVEKGVDGLAFNCYVNNKIDDYWVPNLEKELKKNVPEIAKRIAASNS